MSYRYAAGTYGRAVTEKRQTFVYLTAVLAGSGFALLVANVLGWQVIPAPVAAFLIVGALGTGTFSAMGNQPMGEVYFPRTDGLWLDLTGHHTVNASYMVGGLPAGELLAGYPGGFVAATVISIERSGRMSAGDELCCVTLLVAAPLKRSYRTRLLMHLVPGDEDRIAPGRVLLAARFTMGEPDIAILSERDIAELGADERTLADEALGVARAPERAPHLPIRDSRSYRQMNYHYNTFFAFWYERPYAVIQDIRERGDWWRYLRTAGVFFAGIIGTLLLVLLLTALMLLVPAFDGSGPGAYN